MPVVTGVQFKLFSYVMFLFVCVFITCWYEHFMHFSKCCIDGIRRRQKERKKQEATEQAGTKLFILPWSYPAAWQTIQHDRSNKTAQMHQAKNKQTNKKPALWLHNIPMNIQILQLHWMLVVMLNTNSTATDQKRKGQIHCHLIAFYRQINRWVKSTFPPGILPTAPCETHTPKDICRSNTSAMQWCMVL